MPSRSRCKSSAQAALVVQDFVKLHATAVQITHRLIDIKQEQSNAEQSLMRVLFPTAGLIGSSEVLRYHQDLWKDALENIAKTLKQQEMAAELVQQQCQQLLNQWSATTLKSTKDAIQGEITLNQVSWSIPYFRTLCLRYRILVYRLGCKKSYCVSII